jgi:hypothetical protein
LLKLLQNPYLTGSPAIYFFLSFLGFLVSFLRALFPLAMIDLRVESPRNTSSRDDMCGGSHAYVFTISAKAGETLQKKRKKGKHSSRAPKSRIATARPAKKKPPPEKRINRSFSVPAGLNVTEPRTLEPHRKASSWVQLKAHSRE